MEGKRQEKCSAVGEGSSLDAEAIARVWRLLERRGREGNRSRKLPTISTQGGESGRPEEHMAVGH